MPDEQIIDVTKCIHFDKSDIPNGCTCYWDGECNHYCYYKKYTYKHQECEKLKQTLIEIKEIARQEIDSKEFMIVQCMLNGSVDDKNKVLKQILQKISEVIKDEKV